MRYEIRPLGPWDRPVTTGRARSGKFRAAWQSTLDLLAREVEFLDGSMVVLQIDVTEGEIRRDGMLRSQARVNFPGVKVSFESRHGPLTYATDAYDRWYASEPPGWQANIRAIALALEALRAVDRYGVTSRGEQYRGWTAITAHTGEVAMTREQAAALLADPGHTSLVSGDLLANPAVAARAYLQAVKVYHPDIGGDAELFRRLTAARDLLLAGGGR